MSIIIRLQNLPWSANALDIRNYFTGLQIPEGGVHIVGGELGDAFIAFSTDEDARQAFLRSDGKIKLVQIKLMLSSRTEMQRVIEQARTQSMAAFMLPGNTPVTAPLPAAVPSVIPAAVPDIKRDSKERDPDKKRDRKRSRSRSKSRDRRDRSRDRKDRRHRDRSRSRSRDRRDRRRRDRSKSPNRSRDKDTRRKDRGKSPKREDKDDSSPFQRDARKGMPEVWAASTPKALNIIPPMSSNDGPGILGAYPPMNPPKRNLMDNIGGNLPTPGLNGFPGNIQMRDQGFGIGNQQGLPLRSRESWPPANVVPSGAVPLAVSAAQRRNALDSFGRSADNFQTHHNNSNNRGSREDSRRDFNPREDSRRDFNHREDSRRDFNPRDKERTKTPAPSHFESRNENNGRRSRFDDESPPIDACISMQPFYGSYGDLRRFFNGLSINYKGIKVINDELGHKTGTCFVQFRDAHNKNEALKMNDQKLDNVTVKIQHISDKVFEEAIDRYNPRMDQGNSTEDQFGRTRPRPPSKPYRNPAAVESSIKEFLCLKVEDLPTFVKEQDILHIFSQHPLTSLHLNFKPKRGTVAYVKFGSKEVAKMALAEKTHHVISSKPVTVKPCTDAEFQEIENEQNDALEEEKPQDVGTDCLSISQLPAKTNDRDISDFFSDIGVIPTKIHLMSNNMGFTGQAYCEFETKEEATRAASKNSTVLGQNTISVLPITRAEMEGVLNNSLPHPGIALGLPLAPGTPLPPIKPVAVPKTEPVPFIKPESLPKLEPQPDIKPVIPERIAEAPIKALVTPGSSLNPIPLPENRKSLQIQPLMRSLSGRAPLTRGPDNLDKLNNPRGSHDNLENRGGPRVGVDKLDRGGPRDGPETFDFVGPRGGGDNLDFSGSRGGPDDFNGPRGGPDNFNGPRGGPDNFNGPRGGPDNFNGPRGGPDNFNGPRGGPDNFNGPRGGPDFRDNFNGPRGRTDFRDNFKGPRGGGNFNGTRGSRFGSRVGSRFSDDGPRFKDRVDDDLRFNTREEEGTRFNPRRDEGPGGFNPNMDDGQEDAPGCTVYMENVPYKAGTNEILDFFEGYNCTNNVSRRYNPDNTPSAEAKVTFYTPEDAFRALRELHGAKIWGRAIYLRQS